MTWEPPAAELEYALNRTRILRENDAPHWAEVRERLRAEGILPEDAVLCFWHGSGGGRSTGLIGTRDRRLLKFGIDFEDDPDGQPSEDRGSIYKWAEIPAQAAKMTPAGWPDIYLQTLEIARVLLEQENG